MKILLMNSSIMATFFTILLLLCGISPKNTSYLIKLSIFKKKEIFMNYMLEINANTT